eukprot:CAMPEP_0117456050 /NCGR_PEP_ID=MMETSP0759-20121206/11677_1 /TAXON_ID=63605 /ORGANISM="Percolomonas cosmopolitus, Strain WS" /LENGTH=881 /DNA_ID=CAMNT_0005249377 /DNA_START=485 /DNA_END=3131 /DNA_ORIENTATION=-
MSTHAPPVSSHNKMLSSLSIFVLYYFATTSFLLLSHKSQSLPTPSTLLLGSPSSTSPFYEHTTDLFNANSRRYVKLIEKNTDDARNMFDRHALDITALDVVHPRGASFEQGASGAIYASGASPPIDSFLFPSDVGALGIVYNLSPDLDDPSFSNDDSNEDNDSLVADSTTNVIFSMEILVGIYNGTIRYWDDASLRQLNPERQLPHELIHVLHRSDDSGTSWQLTSFFAHHSKPWADKYGNGTHVKWELEQPYVISSNEEMLKYVSKKHFSIGYISLQSMFDVANLHDYLQRVQVGQIVNSMRSPHDDPKSPDEVNLTSFAPNWQSIQKSFDLWHDSLMNEDDEDDSDDPAQPIQNVTYPSLTRGGQSRATRNRQRPSENILSRARQSIAGWLFGGENSNTDANSLHKLKKLMDHSLRHPLLLQQDGYPLAAFSYLCAHVDFDSKRDNIAKTLYDFVEFSYQHGSTVKEQFHIIALPEHIQDFILDTLSDKLTCRGNACFSDTHYVQFMIIGLSAIVTLLVGLFVFTICCLSCGGGRNWLLKRKGAHLLDDHGEESEMLPLLRIGKKSAASDILPHVYDRTLELAAPESAAASGAEGTIDGLELIELIGRGSFSEVFFGRYHMSPCAVKRFFSLSPHDQVFEQCKTEVEMLRKIHHPNIVQYLASFIDRPPNFYIVMDYHSRGDLQRILLDSPDIEMPLKLRVHLALDAARGLFFLHSLKPPILHRDFKSSNLLVAQDWTLRIGDLGLAKELNPIDQTMCGSAETASPEVFEHLPYSEKSDVFSFCMVLWQIFTRRRIYEGKTVLEVSQEVVYDNLRPSLKDTHMPRDIVNILKRGWQKTPSKRPDMRDIVEILEQLLEECNEEESEIDVEDDALSSLSVQ